MKERKKLAQEKRAQRKSTREAEIMERADRREQG